MNIEKQKIIALNNCKAIYRDYTLEEVERFAPRSVQHAWETGKALSDYDREASKKKLDNFTL